MKEADSFLKNEAVRKYLHEEEIAKAFSSGRIVRTQRVLTWKLIPPVEQDLQTQPTKADAQLWTRNWC